MPEPEDDQSVFNEPHLRPENKPVDPSETKAEQTLKRENRKTDDRCHAEQGVYDEPDIFLGREPEVVEQDWSCSQCGYNLRGLPTGHPCPECGHRELYRPAARGAEGYQSWLRRRLEATSDQKAWTVALLMALCGGPWAVLAAFFHTNPGMLAGHSLIVMAVVFGPVIEETMKIAAAAWTVEVRPYLFRRVEHVQIATIGTALLFATIENVLYLYVYVPQHSTEYALWRWTVCVAMHVGCTLIATRGLVEVWQQTVTELRPPKLTRGFRALVVAIVLHGCYNAAAVTYEAIAG